ncbi:MAG: hypothetical protein JXA04_04335 [Gammaproteobacteria bacterium]|nr:hypothetical protein [Gammaproteobacteria bacterium]
MRLLLILLAAVFFVLAVRALLTKPAEKRTPKKVKGEAVVPCSLCKLHIPKSEAFYSDNHFFCSANHQRQWLETRKHKQ